MKALKVLGLTVSLVAACGTVQEEGRTTPQCGGGKCDDAGADERFTCRAPGTGAPTDCEFIVIGSGAGGGPVAARLAEAGHTVLLLEAGEDFGDKPEYQTPAFHPFASEDPDMRWDYFVKHYSDEEQALRDSKMARDDNGDPKGILYPRVGALGGCTAHNALISVKPHHRDWERLVELSGEDDQTQEIWGPEVMDPYFDRVTDWLGYEFADPRLLVGDGRLKRIVTAAAAAIVNDRGDEIGVVELFRDISELFGLLTADVNDDNASEEGVYLFPLATRDGRRRGTRDRLLEVVDDGAPLTIATGSFVTRVLFADEPGLDGKPRAIGVEVAPKHEVYEADPSADLSEPMPETIEVFATHEVIVSAGAFNTPQLLKLSGVGPREELESLGIEPRVELPGVGRNLQDRYEVGIVGQVQKEDDPDETVVFEALEDCNFELHSSDPCYAEWQEDGSGVYATNGALAAVLKRSSPDEPDPNFFIFGLPGSFRGYSPNYALETLDLDRDGDGVRDPGAVPDKSHFTWAALEAHTHNRAGTVTLRSADPRRMPEINFRYFDDGDTDEGQDEHDLRAMVDAIKFVRGIHESTNRLMDLDINVFTAEDRYVEQIPGPEVDTDEEIAQFAKDEAWGHHACCTAKIGKASDEMSVLDARLRVHGVEGLRVVDASIFPEIPGLFIVMPLYMASERAADLILEDWDR